MRSWYRFTVWRAGPGSGRAVPNLYGLAGRAGPVHGPQPPDPYSARRLKRSGRVLNRPVLDGFGRSKKQFGACRSVRFGPNDHLYSALKYTLDIVQVRHSLNCNIRALVWYSLRPSQLYTVAFFGCPIICIHSQNSNFL